MMTSLKSEIHHGLSLLEFSRFEVRTLAIDSAVLRGNPLGDPNVRRNPVLVPLGAPPDQGWPVVLILSGLGSNAPSAFNWKAMGLNVAQAIDHAESVGEAPRAIYVFCDAMTKWGGSQFINSQGCGRYEDFIVSELVPTLRSSFPVDRDPKRWCVAGGSSGGYGALHLVSRYPEAFALAAAVAPDSFFDVSLLPDLYKAAGVIKASGIRKLEEDLISGRLAKHPHWHSIMNAVAMGLCYASDGAGGCQWPIDLETGELKNDIWARWKEHDPLVFLGQRAASLKRVNRVFLDVGNRDQFHLHFGARLLQKTLIANTVPLDYSEFDGTHFDIGERRIEIWRWLKSLWG